MPGGCGGLGSREQGWAGWRELAATGCCPSMAGSAPGVRVHCEPRPHGPGLENVAASPRVTVRAWNPGKMGSPAVSRARSPRRVGAASWGSPGCRNCAQRRQRSWRREGSQFPSGLGPRIWGEGSEKRKHVTPYQSRSGPGGMGSPPSRRRAVRHRATWESPTQWPRGPPACHSTD